MSDRELDAQVATEVMGWVVNGDAYVTEAVTMTEAWQLIPEFSTDIAAAWLVVEKMVADGYEVHIVVSSEENSVAMFPPGKAIGEYALEKTLPLAICRAALAAAEGGR